MESVSQSSVKDDTLLIQCPLQVDWLIDWSLIDWLIDSLLCIRSPTVMRRSDHNIKTHHSSLNHKISHFSHEWVNSQWVDHELQVFKKKNVREFYTNQSNFDAWDQWRNKSRPNNSIQTEFLYQMPCFLQQRKFYDVFLISEKTRQQQLVTTRWCRLSFFAFRTLFLSHCNAAFAGVVLSTVFCSWSLGWQTSSIIEQPLIEVNELVSWFEWLARYTYED